MKKVFRWIADTLDRKFPDKVTVTMENYLALNARLKTLEDLLAEKRLKAIEDELNKFNVHLGFGGNLDALRGSKRPLER